MQNNAQEFSQVGFARQFVVPAMWLLPIPIIGLMFFLYAEYRFDTDARQEMIQQVQADQELTPKERAEAVEFLKKVRFRGCFLKNQTSPGRWIREFGATMPRFAG